MISLKHLLLESGLLLEIDNNTTLYHRSLHQYKVGDIIDPKVKFGDGSTHWLASQVSEKALEAYRQKNFPDKPSRFKCVYTSIIPNSAFIGKGPVYEVKPMGKWFLTFGNYINKINEQFERRVERCEYLRSPIFGDVGMGRYPEKERWENGWNETYPKYEDYQKAFRAEQDKAMLQEAEYVMTHEFDRYWNPSPNHNISVYKKWVEVLCEQVKVVGVGDPADFKFFQRGDRVKLKEDIEADWYPYMHTTPNKEFTPEELAEIHANFNFAPGNYGREVITLPKGITGNIVAAVPNHTPLPNEHSGNHPDDYKPYRNLRFQPIGWDFYVELSWALRHPKAVAQKLEKCRA